MTSASNETLAAGWRADPDRFCVYETAAAMLSRSGPAAGGNDPGRSMSKRCSSLMTSFVKNQFFTIYRVKRVVLMRRSVDRQDATKPLHRVNSSVN